MNVTLPLFAMIIITIFAYIGASIVGATIAKTIIKLYEKHETKKNTSKQQD